MSVFFCLRGGRLLLFFLLITPAFLPEQGITLLRTIMIAVSIDFFKERLGHSFIRIFYFKSVFLRQLFNSSFLLLGCFIYGQLVGV